MNIENPILLLSYPRSGSSWFSSVFEAISNTLYLREPLTEFFRDELEHGVYRPSDEGISDRYSDRCYDIFTRFKNELTSEALLVERGIDVSKRISVLIKEINLLALDEMLIHEPSIRKVIILIRHPAAIAESWARLGWLADSEWLLSPQGGKNESAYYRFGYTYGMLLSNTISRLSEYNKTIVVKYEDYARRPYTYFRGLMNQLGIQESAKFRDDIKNYCEVRRPPVGKPYEVRRNSSIELVKWKKNISYSTLDEVREGYMCSDLTFYRDKNDWDLPISTEGLDSWAPMIDKI